MNIALLCLSLLFTTLGLSDASSQMVSLVKDINLNAKSSEPRDFITYNNRLYFTADDGVHGRELWVTDGTENGTHIVADIDTTGSSTPRSLIVFNARLYFGATDGIRGSQLWTSDGTDTGTHLVKVVNATGPSGTNKLTILNDKFMFIANDGVHGAEVWISDGTEEGTVLLADINPTEDQIMDGFLNYKGYLYFSQRYGELKSTTWKTDGTLKGTSPLLDTTIGRLALGFYLARPRHCIYHDRIYFENAGELWVSDGTSLGTRFVKDMWSQGDSRPYWFAIHNDNLYFGIYNGKDSAALWVTDGTADGTKQVYQFFEYLPTQLTSYKGKLYFLAADGEPIHGLELWVSDGTEQGTSMLKDFSPDWHGLPNNFTLFNDRIYFTAFSPDPPGCQLWGTDGTLDGTKPIPLPFEPHNNALIGEDPRTYFEFNDCLYFEANYDKTKGFELWKYCPNETVDVSESPVATTTLVSPNPATTQLVMDISEPANIEILDISGKVLLSTVIEPEMPIDVQSLPTGVYWIKKTNGTFLGRFVKQ